MGNNLSTNDAKLNSIVSHFSNLLRSIRKSKININVKKANNLIEKSKTFFNYFDLWKKENDHLDSFYQIFDKVFIVINGLSDFLELLVEIDTTDPVYCEVFRSFQEDFDLLVRFLKIFLIDVGDALQNTKFIPNYLSDAILFLELTILNYAFAVKSVNMLPYYTLSFLNCYSLKNDIIESDYKFASLAMPPGSGKTILVPLFLTLKMLKMMLREFQNTRKIFYSYNVIIIVQNKSDISLFINEINKVFADSKQEMPFAFSFSPQNLRQKIKKAHTLPTILILTSHDALIYIGGLSKDFYDRSVFAINDINNRNIETYILVQKIKNNIINSNTSSATFISTVYDEQFLKLIGNHVVLPKEDNLGNNSNIKEDILPIPSHEILIKKQFLKEFVSIIDNWAEKEIGFPTGTCILFLSSDIQGAKLLKFLQRYYKNSKSILILTNKIGPEDKIETFYENVLSMIESHENDGYSLFLLPIHLVSSKVSNKNEILLSNTKIPPPLIGKLVKLVITADFYAFSPQTSVVIDTGIIQSNIYDDNDGLFRVRHFLLPNEYREMRKSILNQNSYRSLYIKFELNSTNNIQILPNANQKINIQKSFLLLRDLNIKIESESILSNLLDKGSIQKCLDKMKNIEIIDSNYELTEFGQCAVQFSSIDPLLALAIAKYGNCDQKLHEFDENYMIFGYFVSLIIENSLKLVSNPNSKFLFEHFNEDSDIITLINAIYSMIDSYQIDNANDTGLAINILESIYSDIYSYIYPGSFEISEGKKIVFDSIKWAKDQPGGVMECVNTFISQIDKQFLDARKGTFLYICNAGQGLTPRVVFRGLNANLNFENDKAKISFAQRPGWHGLTVPGSIISLGILRNESNKSNEGFLLHRDNQQIQNLLGTISQEIDNPCISSSFFITLFDAYWDKETNLNAFNGIWYIKKPIQNKQEHSFLIHTSESHGHTFINYCPKSNVVESKMKTAIKTLAKLMPFVPRSILIHNDLLNCVVEIISYGSQKYISIVHLLDENPPKVLPLNSITLDFAAKNIDLLAKTSPQIRFGITGESLTYKFINGHPKDPILKYPDVSSELEYVFNEGYASHLVLVIDGDLQISPPYVKFIPWINPNSNTAKPPQDEKMTHFELDSINIVSKALSGYCLMKKSSDTFFVSLDNSLPMINSNYVKLLPQNISKNLDLSQDYIIRNGIFFLFQSVIGYYIQNQELLSPIPIQEITSTESCTKYISDNQKSQIIRNITTILMKEFGIKYQSKIDIVFIGNSILCIKIQDLPDNLCHHSPPLDLYDKSYKQCNADKMILSALQSNKIPATCSIHEPCIKIICNHTTDMNIPNNQFTQEIYQKALQYGFLVSKIYNYKLNTKIKNNICGKLKIEIYGAMSGISLALEMNRLLNSFSKRTIKIGKTRNFLRSRSKLDPRLGQAPSFNSEDNIYKVKESEIATIKLLIENYSKHIDQKSWKFNEKYRVLVVPTSQEKMMKIMMDELKHNSLKLVCNYTCESDPPNIIPCNIYVYDKDNKVTKYGICKECMLSNFLHNSPLMSVMNKNTLELDLAKLGALTEIIKPIPTVYCDEDNEYVWPQVPIGQLAWALLSDKTSEISKLLKCWFTAVSIFSIRNSRQYFTFCPNHPSKIFRIPKEPIEIKCQCQHCDMIYCVVCFKWHRKNECQELDPSIKRCPQCGIPTDKISGCNHMTCICGCHWCYQCEKSEIYRTQAECYAHMRIVHGTFV